MQKSLLHKKRATGSFFERQLNSMISIFKNRRIRDKLILMILIVSMIFMCAMIMLFTSLRNSFESSLQERSAQLLSMITLNIDEQLKEVEQLSYDVFTSDVIQQSLPLPQETAAFNLAASKVYTEIYRLLAGHNYVLAISYLNPVGEDLIVGRSVSLPSVSESFIKTLYEKASSRNGLYLWSSGEASNSLFLTRMIRQIENLSFEELGVITFSVDIGRIIRDLTRTGDSSQLSLCILSDDGPIYMGHTLPEGYHSAADIRTSGSEIVSIGNARYYLTFSRSSYTGWTYVSVAPFRDLYRHSRSIETTALTVLSFFSLLAILIAVRISVRITRPIEQLAVRMQQFHPDSLPVVPDAHQDEVALLTQNFEALQERIDRLIEENYVRQIALKDSQYNMLQTQINPHFLYNTLDSINWMAKGSSTPAISTMVESLASLLRETINVEARNVTLREEFALLEHYLTIQRIRLQEAFSCEIDAPEETLVCQIPRFSLQPLIENCIAYGYDPETQKVTIRITVRAQEDWITISVKDDGPGIPENVLQQLRDGSFQRAASHGIGLKNIDERLNIAYSGQYFLKIEEGPEGRKNVVVIRIPFWT